MSEQKNIKGVQTTLVSHHINYQLFGSCLNHFRGIQVSNILVKDVAYTSPTMYNWRAMALYWFWW